ncbi:MAG TPA: DUF3533 domain-containing protein [Acidimicrobiales bacterium]|nr:DUF3533 domain-containing protein [Acidimicrobiales bacterium]
MTNLVSGPGSASPEVRAAKLLRARAVWAFPLAAAALVVMLMTLIYFGSIVDPTAHLHGLPVLVVDEDTGARTAVGKTNLGQELVTELTGSGAVTDRLALEVTNLPAAEAKMDKGADYATLVVPRDFSASVMALAGGAGAANASGVLPTVEILTNERMGTLGVSLATGVLQPAVEKISRGIGREVLIPAAKTGTAEAPADLLADPVSLSTVTYRPLPSHSGLGLSAFYIALLITMSGFLGATIVNSSLDAVLGYATSEVGPWWRQRAPARISRWQTLLAKWALAVVVTFVGTGLLLGVAAGILRMDAPHVLDLWLFAWYASAVIAVGTLALYAALGSLGQLLGLLGFVYLALASSGGTIPLQALAGFYRFVANFEPLRQILGAVRAIIYFNAAGDAGLDRGLVLTSIGLVLWVVVGFAVTAWYDRKGMYRVEPGLGEAVTTSVRAYRDQRTGRPTGEGAG